jgi:glycosyltransferase involved in cell wall biosynthesis
MTRLMHLAAYEPEQRGSFVPFVLAVLREARDCGWDVEAVFPETACQHFWLADFRGAGIPVAFASGSRRHLTRWLDERLDGNEPVILHTHFTRYDIPAALVARSRPDVHVYWHIHTVLSRRPRAFAGHMAKFRTMGRYVDMILSPAANVAESVARRGGDRSKISVFPSVIDPTAFPTITPKQRDEARRALGVPPQAEVLLHFGRDWHIKGGRVFLDALAALLAEGRPVLGLFNQPGAEARRYVERRGLGDHVKMIDLVPDSRALYGAADVMVAPSRGEAMPFTVMESLCSGTPVVASDLPGHRVLGDALENCMIVPRRPQSFAAAIRAFLERDADARARLGDVARIWIAERFDVRVAAQCLLEAYEESLAGVVAARRWVTTGGSG